MWRALCAAAIVVSALACEEDATTPAATSGDPGGVGGGATGGGPAQGGQGGNGANSSTSSGVGTPLYLGVVTNPLTPDGMAPTPASVLEAELTAYASGARLMGVDVAWDALDAASASEIASRIDAHRQKGMHIVLSLLVVDGGRSHRPEGLGGWSDPGTTAALAASIDLLLAAMDPPDALILGRRADAYVTAHPTEGDALTSLLDGAVQALTAQSLPTGVGVTFVGSDPPASHASLSVLGDVAAFSYLPGLGESSFPANTSAASDLDEMAAEAGGRAIVLQQVGYPASPDLGASLDMQATQLDGFFAALAPRAESFPYALVHQLHDLDEASCDSWLADQGLGPADPAGSHFCTTGLRDATGEQKAAWPRFLAATAHYARP